MTEEQEAGTISIGDIIKRLWNARGLIVALPALGLLLGLSIVSWAVYFTQNPVTYYISLNNIRNAQYPNGSQFRPGDLISRPVLDSLRQRLKIAPDVDLAGNIRVTFDSPMAASVETLYRNRLSARNLTQADINSLNAAFTQQLQAAINTTLRIDVDYDAMGLSKAMGTEIALALPGIWTDVYTKQFRTLVAERLATSVTAITADDFQNPTGVLEVSANLNEMNNGLLAIANDNRLRSVQDGQGSTASELLQRLDLYTVVYSTPIFIRYVAGSPIASGIYQRDQQLRITQLNERIASIDESIKALQSFQAGTVSAGANQPGPAGQAPGVQLDSSAINEIVSLTEKASNADFLRELLRSRQDIADQVGAIKRRFELMRPADEWNTVITNDFVMLAYDGYTKLTDSYNQIARAAQERAEDQSGAFYQPLTTPSAQRDLFNIRYLALIAGLALAGLFAACAYALFATPARRMREGI